MLILNSIPSPEYSRALRSLLPQAPLTLRGALTHHSSSISVKYIIACADARGKLPQQLPYTLVSSAAQFRNLQVGRRKALEVRRSVRAMSWTIDSCSFQWSRARVLRAAYDALCASCETAQEETHVPLTTLDVLHWLEDQGLYPRSINSKPSSSAPAVSAFTKRKQAAIKREDEVPESELYCRHCGLPYSCHPSAATLAEQNQVLVAAHDIKQEPVPFTVSASTASAVCLTFNGDTASLRPLDVSKLLRQPSSFMLHGDAHVGQANHAHAQRISDRTHFSPRDLMMVADPALVLPIQRMCAKWYPRGFPTAAPGFTGHLTSAPGTETQESSKDDVARDLSPAALLSLATHSLVKALIQGGLDEHQRDQTGLRALSAKRHPRRSAQNGRLLTPSHIFRGLTHDTTRTPLANALYTAFAPLGISLTAAHDEGDTPSADEGP